jgi:hypothetical protein
LGKRVAVLRALTGARLYGNGSTISLADAAESVGSNVRYVRAAVTILKAENPNLIWEVLWGPGNLLATAAKVRKRADLVAAYRKASPDDRKVFGWTVGPATVFDEVVVPAL